ncbi:hypothetical protein HOG48_05930, partial [Candidatus Peregrinibacteria bacterium]|nr:hypothetical protein [Candidatus Peregrinibacteria bacterium]
MPQKPTIRKQLELLERKPLIDVTEKTMEDMLGMKYLIATLRAQIKQFRKKLAEIATERDQLRREKANLAHQTSDLKKRSKTPAQRLHPAIIAALGGLSVLALMLIIFLKPDNEPHLPEESDIEAAVRRYCEENGVPGTFYKGNGEETKVTDGHFLRVD